MDETKPRVIIDRPESMSDLRKGTEWSLTAFGWFVWGFLARPLLILALWYLGVRQAYVHMIKLGGIRYFLLFIKGYAFVVAAVLIALFGWNLYNRLRFRKKDRRKRVPHAAHEELARILSIQAQELRRLHDSKTISIEFQEEGRLLFELDGAAPSTSRPAIPGRYNPSHLPPMSQASQGLETS